MAKRKRYSERVVKALKKVPGIDNPYAVATAMRKRSRRRRRGASTMSDMRTAIAGVPRAGKSTLASKMQGTKFATDDLIELGWSEASAAASEWFDRTDSDLLVEGVAVPRAIRKWLARNAEGKPVDRVVWMGDARIPLSRGQRMMAKACHTVWREILPELKRRGVEIVAQDQV